MQLRDGSQTSDPRLGRVHQRIAEAPAEIERLCAEIPGLAEMCKEFRIQSKVTQLYMLTSPDPALGGQSPLDTLRQVRDLIAGYGEQ